MISLIAGGSALAGDAVAFQVTDIDNYYQTGGMMALGLSSSGRYIVGACASWQGFLYDIGTGKLVVTDDAMGSVGDGTGATQFWTADENGYAYGWDGNGAIRVGIDGSYTVLVRAEGDNAFMPQGVSADGSVVAGYRASSLVWTEPCYYENGQLIDLPYPGSEEVGFKINSGARAIGISDDGSIILGYLGNRAQTHPMVYWLRQDDGTYKYVAAYEDNYEDSRDVNGDQKPYYTTRMPKLFMPACISGDGRSIVLYIQRVIENGAEPYVGPEEVAVYDVASGEYSVIPFSRSNLLYSEDMFEISGIANDGTLAGFAGVAESSTPLILKPGSYDKPMLLTEAFPGQPLLEVYQRFEDERHALYLLTGISADGQTVSGYIEGGVEDIGVLDPFGFLTYYVTTAEFGDSGVDGVAADGIEAAPVYYDLQGRRVSHPDRGLYIKVTGNKAEKVIK